MNKKGFEKQKAVTSLMKEYKLKKFIRKTKTKRLLEDIYQKFLIRWMSMMINSFKAIILSNQVIITLCSKYCILKCLSKNNLENSSNQHFSTVRDLPLSDKIFGAVTYVLLYTIIGIHIDIDSFDIDRNFD